MKYLSSRIDENIFDMFNLACSEIGQSKQSVMNKLITLFIEEKENMENEELVKLASSRYKKHQENSKTYSLEEMKEIAKI